MGVPLHLRDGLLDGVAGEEGAAGERVVGDAAGESSVAEDAADAWSAIFFPGDAYEPSPEVLLPPSEAVPFTDGGVIGKGVATAL